MSRKPGQVHFVVVAYGGAEVALNHGLGRSWIALALAVMSLGLLVGLNFGLQYGLTAWLYYEWLRRRLARLGLLPRRLREFLDWCALPERGWLRVSDAYEFRHRELLDHLSPGWAHRHSGALTGQSSEILSLAFSPDGRALASGGLDGTIGLWDTIAHRELGEPLIGHTSAVVSMTFSPDERTLASGSLDGTIRLWDTTAQRQVGLPLSAHTRGVSSVAFSPDGNILASGSDDCTVMLWDIPKHRPAGRSAMGHASPILAVMFSLDGKTLSTVTEHTAVQEWDIATRCQLSTGHADHSDVAHDPTCRPRREPGPARP